MKGLTTELFCPQMICKYNTIVSRSTPTPSTQWRRNVERVSMRHSDSNCLLFFRQGSCRRQRLDETLLPSTDATTTTQERDPRPSPARLTVGSLLMRIPTTDCPRASVQSHEPLFTQLVNVHRPRNTHGSASSHQELCTTSYAVQRDAMPWIAT